jgi:hypothetical protein
MVLVIHDRFVDKRRIDPSRVAAFTIVRDLSDGANVDVLDPTTLVTKRPGGHGDEPDARWRQLPRPRRSRPPRRYRGNARLILSRGNPAEIVTFSYPFGAGAVLYSDDSARRLLQGNPTPGDRLDLRAERRGVRATQINTVQCPAGDVRRRRGLHDRTSACPRSAASSCARTSRTTAPAATATTAPTTTCDSASGCFSENDDTNGCKRWKHLHPRRPLRRRRVPGRRPVPLQ